MTNTCNAFRNILYSFKERKRDTKARFHGLFISAIPSDGIIKHYLETSKTIAVVGLSDREDTTSHRVSKGMQERAIGLFPVNPVQPVG